MSRPVLVVFLFLLLIITTQFEWRQQLPNDIDTSLVGSQKQPQISKREEGVKEKIILSQERKIQMLNELVRSLREQLQQCRNNSESMNGNTRNMELEQHQILDD